MGSKKSNKKVYSSTSTFTPISPYISADPIYQQKWWFRCISTGCPETNCIEWHLKLLCLDSLIHSLMKKSAIQMPMYPITGNRKYIFLCEFQIRITVEWVPTSPSRTVFRHSHRTVNTSNFKNAEIHMLASVPTHIWKKRDRSNDICQIGGSKFSSPMRFWVNFWFWPIFICYLWTNYK